MPPRDPMSQKFELTEEIVFMKEKISVIKGEARNFNQIIEKKSV